MKCRSIKTAYGRAAIRQDSRTGSSPSKWRAVCGLETITNWATRSGKRSIRRVISAAGASVLKRAFSRARPYQGNNPDAWFKGSGYQSFPSGEVTLQASFVTPFIANYGRQDPWVWALEALPVYDAFARLKSQAHWQTDVIAGWALGTAVGYWSTTRAIPLSVRLLPGGLSVGFAKQF